MRVSPLGAEVDADGERRLPVNDGELPMQDHLPRRRHGHCPSHPGPLPPRGRTPRHRLRRGRRVERHGGLREGLGEILLRGHTVNAP